MKKKPAASHSPSPSTPVSASRRPNPWLTGHRGPLLLLLAVLLVLFARSFLPGTTLANGDANLSVFLSNYRMLPMSYFVSWAPQCDLGNPGSPTPLTPGYLLAHVVPATKFADANYVFHLLLLGILGYFLLRDMKRDRLSSTVGALFLMLQPHVFSHILPGHTGHFLMAGYVPGMFLFLRKAVRTNHPAYWGLAGAFLGLLLSAGTHDVAFFFVLLFAAYALLLLTRRVVAPQASDASVPLAGAQWLHLLAGIAVAGILCFAISYQALFVNLARQIKTSSSDATPAPGETGMTAEQRWFWATQWSGTPEEAIDFAIPGFFGWGTSSRENPYRGRIGQTEGWPEHHQGMPNLNDISNYLGAIILFGCLFAVVFRRRDPEMWFFLVAALLACILSFGKHAPLFRWFYAVPYMDTMRNPVKWFYITSFCAGILAPMGISALLDCSTGIRNWSLRAKVAILVIPIAVVLLGGMFFLAGKQNAASDPLWSNPSLVALSGQALFIGLLFWVAAAVAFFGLIQPPAQHPTKSSPVDPSAIRLWPRILLLAVVLVELAYVNSHYLPYHRSADEIPPPGPVGEFLATQPQPFRIKVLGNTPLSTFMGQLIGYAGYDVVEPPSSRNTDDLYPFLRAIGQDTRKYLQLCNVRFLIAPGQLREPFGKPVLNLKAGDSPLIVYEFTDFLPRYYLVPKWQIVNSPAARFSSVGDPKFKPAEEVLINETRASIPACTNAPGEPRIASRIAEHSWHQVRVHIDVDRDCMLVGLERHDPSWKAWLDDREIPIWHANGMLRAMHIPAGKHQVILKVTSQGITPMVLALSGWLGGIACAVWAWRTRPT